MKAIPHRHWLSHCPIVGTLGRLLYMTLMGGLIWLLLGRPPLPFVLVNLPAGWIAAFVAGLMVSDTAHWLMDSELWARLEKARE